jgi:hypothetical protein
VIRVRREDFGPEPRRTPHQTPSGTWVASRSGVGLAVPDLGVLAWLSFTHSAWLDLADDEVDRAGTRLREAADESLASASSARAVLTFESPSHDAHAAIETGQLVEVRGLKTIG